LSRRRRRHRRGDRLDVRASLRHSTRSGGDPAVPIRRTRKWTPRRLVALLDISGSMEPYARAYLHLLWGAATRAHAEVFVFGTRLTRLTRALRNANPDLALERAAALMPDWSGGTRIGRAVREFMDLYGRRGMARGAVVLIVSDGWERDDPSLLAQQMAALGRHAHRVVWANPRAAAPGFAPVAGGMAVALPHIDSFVSGHSVDALIEVVRALGATITSSNHRLVGTWLTYSSTGV
ncbi:MAG TPA: VWA domain-containing protein, partial [Mycobacterium sp.]|nr:VWA domain-containing protein [Mycobacterium sp.]